MLNDIKMRIICSGIRSQWPFENLRRPKKIYDDPGIEDHFSKMARYIWLNFVLSSSRNLLLIDIKMKKIGNRIRSQ